MIPVLGVPCLRRDDLLANMLASIDEEVGELVIIDNTRVQRIHAEIADGMARQPRVVAIAKPGHDAWEGD